MIFSNKDLLLPNFNESMELLAMKQNILITGGAGFLDQFFFIPLCKKISSAYIICIDSLTYASNLKFLSNLNQYTNYKFIKGDIKDRDFCFRYF